MPKSKIINGKTLADKILRDIRREIVEKNLQPALAIILVGNNPASKIYVKLKQKAALLCGLDFFLYQIPKNAPEEQILDCLDFLNQDQDIHGLIVQLPLPKKFDADKIISRLNPQKDADGFHPKNLKLLLKGQPYVIPGLCEGIIRLIKKTGKNLTDKKILVISNNKIFAQPLTYLIGKNLCGSSKKCRSVWAQPNDPALAQKSQLADVIIIAAGIPKFLKAKMIKKDAILIDVGYTQVNGQPVGDVDFSSCASKASFISPVPGGVGPLTVALLLANVIKLCEKSYKQL